MKKAVNATSPILVFCPADKVVSPGKTFPTSYENTVRVAATDEYGQLRLALQNSIDILIPNQDMKVDLPDYMEGYVSEFMSAVTTALTSGTASLVLLLLRIFNNDQAALKDFLQKHNHGFMVVSA
jgi:hypothetical protein